MEPLIEQIYENVKEGNAVTTPDLVQAALDEGISATVILNEGMIAAMSEVGRLFEEGDYFVPEMLIAARAMQAGLGVLRPYLVAEDVQPAGVIALGTVKGDLHDIGKNLVAMMVEGAGFEINDLGTDVAPETFVEAIRSGASVVGLSALLTTTMPMIAKTIEAIDAAGLRDQVKIMVGGAPVTAGYAASIGADGYAPDASQAAKLAKSFVE
ncbi:MAG: corrinoid protein [Candidatus Promineifilaceae bacterium]|jgi:5-methyltetrahydrofolate--homocysteine methyltransferase